MTTTKVIKGATTAREAIRKALAGAKPVRATITREGALGAYDMRYNDDVTVEWDNGHQTLHHDVFCGQDSLEGGMYRPHVKLVGAIYYDDNHHDLEPDCRLWAFGPREIKRFEAAVALADQDDSDNA